MELKNSFDKKEGGALNRRFFVSVGIFLAIMLVAAGGYYIWFNYFSTQAKYIKQAREMLREQQEIEDRMKNDTYGGKTPEETREMFKIAIKNNDIDLAVKYFAINKQDDIRKRLEESKKEGYWDTFLENLNLPLIYIGELYNGYKQYRSYKGGDEFVTDFVLYPKGVWKIYEF